METLTGGICKLVKMLGTEDEGKVFVFPIIKIVGGEVAAYVSNSCNIYFIKVINAFVAIINSNILTVVKIFLLMLILISALLINRQVSNNFRVNYV